MKQTCPLCRSLQTRHLWTIDRFENDFEIHQCLACGLIRQDPIPKPEQISALYDQAYYSDQAAPGKFTYLDERQNPKGHRAVNRARIRILLKLFRKRSSSKDPAVFLDIGCSFGGLVREAQEAGCRALGVDISSYAVTEGRKSGLDLRQAGPEEIPRLGEKFDLITMIEVIEHLPEPLEALKAIFQATRPGGILVIQTANMDGRQARKARDRYHYFLPGHLVYFSRRTLEMMLARAGFEVIKVSYPCEFGLWPKLVKSRSGFKRLRDYLKWITITKYHLLSKFHFGNFALTSGMVIHARRPLPSSE